MTSGSPAPLPPPPSRLATRAALILYTVLLRAAERIVPPQLAMMMEIGGYWRTHLLYLAARLRIADRVAERPKTGAELATETGMSPDALHRALRALCAFGIFELRSDGRFANNRLSDTLRSDVPGSMRDAAEYFGSPSNVQAWCDFEATVRTGESAFPRVHGVSVWEWLAKHPDEGRAFAGTMTSLTEQAAPSIAAAYDFGRHARVCDVAGGRGTLIAEILARHPGCRGVLFDEAHVLDMAAPYLASRGVADRVERIAGSFFASAPEGCDAYVLKDILHDWDDARCATILGHLRRAMSPSARLLVVETLVEPLSTHLPGPLVDVQMLAVCDGGKQRSDAEMRRLLAASGLRIAKVHDTGTPASILEVTAS